MKLDHVLTVLRGLAPESLAEGWDRVGLHVGDPERRIRRGMLCIDLTHAVLDEALARRIDLIVAYHPPIFEPLKTITPHDPKALLILRAIEARVALYSPHTALDAARGGVNDWLCEGLLTSPGADEVRPIRPTSPPARDPSAHSFKVVTFAPANRLDRLRAALFAAGAGHIGDYSECSFSLDGEGTFRGGDTTNPTIGQRGRLETVRERRLEVAAPGSCLAQVVAALRRAHPYEEPAFDIYALAAPPPDLSGAPQAAEGQGRIVTLRRPIALATLARRVRSSLGVEAVEVAAPAQARPIRTIGVCAGAGGSLLKDAGPIDAFVTGEMRHHDVLAAVERGMAVILAGHTQTERPYLPVYRKRIVQALGAPGKGVAWLVSRTDRPPGSWVR